MGVALLYTKRSCRWWRRRL